jgi:transcriptional regulator GlxA family with amidase domain
MRTISVLMLEGCELSGIGGPLDLFGTANTLAGGEPLLRWRLVSLDGQPVTTSCGVEVQAAGDAGAMEGSDAVVIPGIHFRGERRLLETIDRARSAAPHIRRLHQSGAIIAANCSAVFLLAETGLLLGQATTSWWLGALFRRRYPEIDLRLSAILTEEDNIICSGAVTAYFDIGLRLLERFAGRDLAAQCAKVMLVDANRASQTPYMTVQSMLRHTDELVSRAQKRISDTVADTFSLERLSAEVATSPRTLIRRFVKAIGMTPGAYAQAVRIETAKRLLETTGLPLETILERVGYQDTSAFRRLFKREVGMTPRAYRGRFSMAGDRQGDDAAMAGAAPRR